MTELDPHDPRRLRWLRGPGGIPARLFGSLALSCTLLCLLGLLTFLGTLAQVGSGLHAVQAKYFESWFLLHELGPLPLPLPGAKLVLMLLFCNLAVGGLTRLARRPGKLGVLIVHAGMALLLVAGFIKLYASDDGHVTLFEGQSSDHYQSYYRWEIAIGEQRDDGTLSERVVAQESFDGAHPSAVVRVSAPELPFELEVERFLANCDPLPKGPMFDVDVPVVDGVFLEGQPPEKEAERNAAGVYASVVERATGVRHEAILWGLDRAPFVCEIDGRRYSFDLRHERYPLPFELRLDDFKKIDHPRIDMPQSFSSDVTVVDGATHRPLEISMNEPLRAEGLVLYQASWGPSNARPGEPLFSTFAVVRNPADQLPLVACVVIALGLLLHFSKKLVRWVRREQKNIEGRLTQVSKAAAVLAALSLSSAAQPSVQAAAQPATSEAWSSEAVDALGRLGIQDGGRVKPLSTYASYALLRLSGRRSSRGADGQRRSATEWLLDVLFRPDEARRVQLFLIQDDAVVRAIGLEPRGPKKRDRYTFEELEPGLPRLFQIAHEYSVIPDARRDSVQTQVVGLARNINEFAGLVHQADFARADLILPRGHGLEQVFGERSAISFAEFLGAMPEVAEFFAGASTKDREGVLGLFDTAGSLAEFTGMLALYPPIASVEEQATWLAPVDILRLAYDGQFAAEPHLRALDAFSSLARDPSSDATAAGELSQALVPLAEQRGEYAGVALEVRYYQLGLIRKSLVAFLLAFGALCVGWLVHTRSGARRAYQLASLLAASGALLLVAAITMRCVIRGRPPVSTLYETVLFVTAVGTLVALCLELVNRRRIALSAACVLGTVGLFIANGYELLDKQDTMPSLVAVLDTNFWLATHVTTITIGYAAGMLAALLATLYLLGKAYFSLRPRPERALARRTLTRELGRMVYGVLCFGLIFSVVGTILGGVWANDSWGRFWGWDPKENGALLICLSQTAILHARLGGFLKEHGVCVAATFGGTVVAFSWWGVNLLGVGLHSYGFTSGIHGALWLYYGLQWSVCLIGLALALGERARRASRSTASS